MDIQLDCSICGQSISVNSVETVAMVHGIMDNWSQSHQHNATELKMYMDAEVAIRQYQHSTPFAGNTGEID